MTGSAPPRDGGSELWAITSYFNPQRYRRRLANYRLFRRHLNVPLATVELSFDGSFELNPCDAEILIQRCRGDVMWQKERLLNVALEALPPACRKVAWLDCDVVFGRDDWADAASRMLERCVIVQPFEHLYDLPADASLDQGFTSCGDRPIPSFASQLPRGVSIEQFRRPSSRTGRPPLMPGNAWAARREALQRHGLHDVNIMGGGDCALACAAIGQFENWARIAEMGEPHAEHYIHWGRRFHDVVRGEVGSVAGALAHLWHGHLGNRKFGNRQARLRQCGFDPYHDIAVGDGGCWFWNSDKPALHKLLREYFRLRREDG